VAVRGVLADTGTLSLAVAAFLVDDLAGVTTISPLICGGGAMAGTHLHPESLKREIPVVHLHQRVRRCQCVAARFRLTIVCDLR